MITDTHVKQLSSQLKDIAESLRRSEAQKEQEIALLNSISESLRILCRAVETAEEAM